MVDRVGEAFHVLGSGGDQVGGRVLRGRIPCELLRTLPMFLDRGFHFRGHLHPSIQRWRTACSNGRWQIRLESRRSPGQSNRPVTSGRLVTDRGARQDLIATHRTFASCMACLEDSLLAKSRYPLYPVNAPYMLFQAHGRSRRLPTQRRYETHSPERRQVGTMVTLEVASARAAIYAHPSPT